MALHFSVHVNLLVEERARKSQKKKKFIAWSILSIHFEQNECSKCSMRDPLFISRDIVNLPEYLTLNANPGAL
jgi:hypothetical protein